MCGREVTILTCGAVRAKGVGSVAAGCTALSSTRGNVPAPGSTSPWIMIPSHRLVTIGSPDLRMAVALSASDAALARIVRRDDQPAASGLFDRHGGLLLGLALCMLRDQEAAEVVVVRTFEDICREPPAFDSADDVRHWLLMTAKAHAIAVVRERVSRSSAGTPTTSEQSSALSSPRSSLPASAPGSALHQARGALHRQPLR